MKKITRADLRGKPLEPKCYKAHTTSHEYGKKDNRVYCYGVYGWYDTIDKQCLNCPAYIWNATPPEEK